MTSFIKSMNMGVDPGHPCRTDFSKEINSDVKPFFLILDPAPLYSSCISQRAWSRHPWVYSLKRKAHRGTESKALAISMKARNVCWRSRLRCSMISVSAARF